MIRMVLICLAVIVLFAGCHTASSLIYGPRWTDYRDWGRLAIGMSKQATIDILGEPFLPDSAWAHQGANTEALVFKIRPKFYRYREIGGTGRGLLGTLTSTESKDVYPEHAAETNMWGDLVDLYCYFVNDRLTGWCCPAMSEKLSPLISGESQPEIPQKK